MSNLIFSAELAHESLRSKLGMFTWAIDSTEKVHPDEGIYNRLVHDFLLVKTLFVGHSVAEDTIILPRLKCLTDLPKEFDDDHNEEENLFGEIALALKKIHPRHQDQTEYDADLCNLRRLTGDLKNHLLTHMWEEDNFLFPLIEKHFNFCDLQSLATSVRQHRLVKFALQALSHCNRQGCRMYSPPALMLSAGASAAKPSTPPAPPAGEAAGTAAEAASSPVQNQKRKAEDDPKHADVHANDTKNTDTVNSAATTRGTARTKARSNPKKKALG